MKTFKPTKRLGMIVVVACFVLGDPESALAQCNTDVLRSYGRQISTTTATPSLNLRTGPSRTAPILASLPPGTRVAVLGQRGREWLQVVAITPDCAEALGYVVRQYVR